jgi:hypothetical protein
MHARFVCLELLKVGSGKTLILDDMMHAYLSKFDAESDRIYRNEGEDEREFI